MINVVFLLLIFFLLSSQITPRAPFALVPPTLSDGGNPDPAQTLFMASDEQLFIAAAQDTDPLVWLAAHHSEIERLTLRADAHVSARAVAGLLAKLDSIGIANVDIVGVGR